jgi:acetyltransferase-like isoleucine patch superfamily enzyme
MAHEDQPVVNSPQYDYGLLKSCGEDVFISASVEIRRPQLVTVGSHVAIDTGTYITTGAEIGDYMHIAPYVTVIGGATVKLVLENFNTIAAGCRVICASDEHLGAGFVGPTIPDEYRDNVTFADVKFEMFASVGTNVVVMPGVTLGMGSVVGACSLVTQDTEPWGIYYGVPAKKVKTRPSERMIRYAEKLGYRVGKK